MAELNNTNLEDDNQAEAVALWKKACKLQALEHRERLPEVLNLYKEAKQLAPNLGQIRYSLAVVYHNMDRKEEALVEYQEAIRCKPEHANAHAFLGEILREQGLTNQAIEHFKTALTFDKANKYAHNGYATALKNIDSLDNATLHYQEALKADPNYVPSHQGLGIVYRLLGRFEDAAEHFERALDCVGYQHPSKTSQRATVLVSLGQVLQRKGENARAIERFKEAMECEGSLKEHTGLAQLMERIELSQAVKEEEEREVTKRAHRVFVPSCSALPIESTAYQLVEKIFRRGCPHDQIELMGIEQVSNVLLKERYNLLHRQMERKNDSKGANELWLWHGTSSDTANTIVQQGFNRSYCGKHATHFGKGVYFATSSTYSSQPTFSPPDTDGVRRLFLACVLVGEYSKGEKDCLIPPVKKKEGGMLYDSTVNHTTKPSIYVVFHDCQAFPQFIVSFKGVLPTHNRKHDKVTHNPAADKKANSCEAAAKEDLPQREGAQPRSHKTHNTNNHNKTGDNKTNSISNSTPTSSPSAFKGGMVPHELGNSPSPALSATPVVFPPPTRPPPSSAAPHGQAPDRPSSIGGAHKSRSSDFIRLRSEQYGEEVPEQFQAHSSHKRDSSSHESSGWRKWLKRKDK